MYTADEMYSRKLEERMAAGLYRTLGPSREDEKVDFYSNDYLGFANHGFDAEEIARRLIEEKVPAGSSGSRLVSGNNSWQEALEAHCASFFQAESALFFPNGYMANLALLSAMATRHDTILYDEQAHTSIKDGLRLSLASHYSFKHNDLQDLECRLERAHGCVFVVVESIYSMDGDQCPLEGIVALCERFSAHLVVDEAHSTGVVGLSGQGLAIEKGVASRIWARNYNFGKALGAAGAVLAITQITRQFLINHARPFIYSTAPMPVQTLICHAQLIRLTHSQGEITKLRQVIKAWCKATQSHELLISKNTESPVQYVLLPGNERALAAAAFFEKAGFQVKAMLSPTVKKGTERLRISLHSYNTQAEIELFFSHLHQFQNNFRDRVCL